MRFLFGKVKWWRILLGVLLGVVVVFIVTVARMQRELTFRPARKLIATPEVYDLSYDDLCLKNVDGVIRHGWWMPAENAKAAILFCHTVSGNMSYAIDIYRFFNKNGFSVLTFDYRGFGESEGIPSERGCYEDGRDFLHWLKRKTDSSGEKVLVYGRSAGAAVAARLAATMEIDGLIIEAAYISYPDVAANHPKNAMPFAPLLLWNRFPAGDYICDICCPLLQVHGIGDLEIPIEFGEAVFAAAPEPKIFLKAGGLHGEAYCASASEYAEKLDALMALLNGPLPFR